MPGPPPIDARMPRFNQAVVAVALLGGFVFDLPWVIPVFAVVLGLGAAFGPRYGPFLRVWSDLVAPRLGPATELEDPRPPRFAAVVGAGLLAAASGLLLLGAVGIAWVVALVVAVLAALAAATGLCVGCELYVRAQRNRGVA